MSGEEVKKILTENGYKLTDIASALGIIPQNLHSLLKAEDVKSGVLEKIANALGKDICFFYKQEAINPTQSILSGNGNTVSGNIHISLPEKGFQKIIHSDGSETTVEIATPYEMTNTQVLQEELHALRKENNELKNTIISLQARLLATK